MGPSSTIFPDTIAGSWIRIRIRHESESICDVSITGSSLIYYAKAGILILGQALTLSYGFALHFPKDKTCCLFFLWPQIPFLYLLLGV